MKTLFCFSDNALFVCYDYRDRSHITKCPKRIECWLVCSTRSGRFRHWATSRKTLHNCPVIVSVGLQRLLLLGTNATHNR